MTLTVQETLLFALGLASGVVCYPVMLMFIGPLVELATRPWGKERLPITSAVFGVAALLFLMFTFFGLPAVWVRFSMDATGADWKSTYQIWGMGWFAGLCLFGLIPTIERTLRRRLGKRKPRAAS